MSRSVHLISRSESLFKVCMIDRDGRKFTGLEMLREGNTFHRADIALINVTQPTGHCKTCACDTNSQYLVYVDAGGNLVGNGVMFLDPEQFAWCVEEANKLIELVGTYPEVATYLRGF